MPLTEQQREELERLAQLGGYRLMPDWQPVETAPKDGTPILAFSPREGVFIAECSVILGPDGEPLSEGWYKADATSPMDEPPTHWMPLPDDPMPDWRIDGREVRDGDSLELEWEPGVWVPVTVEYAEFITGVRLLAHHEDGDITELSESDVGRLRWPAGLQQNGGEGR